MIISGKLQKLKKKKFDHDRNCKYITTQEFNKLTVETFAAWLKQSNLATKADIADFVKDTDFDNKLKSLNKNNASNKIKHLKA